MSASARKPDDATRRLNLAMNMIPALILMLVSAAVQATATLECSAPPYHVAFVVSHEHGVVAVTLRDASGLAAQMDAARLDSIDLRWPNTVAAARNRLTFAGRFGPELDVRGQVEAGEGRLVVNGEIYPLTCDWLM